jgi:uncharacterized protein involved in exopolysaccharide biosynthesis
VASDLLFAVEKEGLHPVSRVRFVRQSNLTEFSLLNECLVSLRNRRKLIYLVLASTLLLAAIGVVVFPRSFTATATVMPASNNTPVMPMSAVIPGMTVFSTGNSQLNLYLELLKSNQVRDSLLAYYGIRRDLQHHAATLPDPEWYDEDAIREAVRSISASVNTKSGVVDISVTAGDAELSANIVNNLVHQLDLRLQRLEQDNAAGVSDYFTGQIVEEREKLKQVEEEKAGFMAKNRNYAISDDPELRVELDRLEMNVQFHRQLLLTLLELKAKNDLEAEKNVPRLTVIEWAEVPSGNFLFSRVKFVIMATLGMAAFAVGLIVLRVTYEWYVPSATRTVLAESCTTVGRDAQQVINRIRRPFKIPEQTGV